MRRIGRICPTPDSGYTQPVPKPITPADRVDLWKKKWGTSRLLSDNEATAAFDEFVAAFIPGHMEKRFLKTFGVYRAKFGNRFFKEEAVYHTFSEVLSRLMSTESTHAVVTVIYALDGELEAHTFRGEIRRSLGDLFLDDWHAACAIVRTEDALMYAFVEPKMKGSVTLTMASGE